MHQSTFAELVSASNNQKMKATIKISRYINDMTQENLFTHKILPDLDHTHPDVWKRYKRYAY